MHGSSGETPNTQTENQAPEDAHSLSVAEKRLILIAALVQGLVLYWLKSWSGSEDWLPVWRYLCYTLSIAIPPLVIVTTAPRLAHSYWWVIAGYALLLGLVASYRGYQCTPTDMVHCNWPHTFIVTTAIASFVVAFLLRACATGVQRLRRPEYPALFHYSWDIALTVGLTLVFTAIFWLILFLWQALFSLVGVALFRELFSKEWFIFPVTGLVVGCGAVLFRSQQSFVLTLKRLLRTMLVALLPLLALLTIVFLATLPFTGLQPIWNTGHGSALLLWLVALLLFFSNGVIQDEFPFSRYPKWVNRVLLLALVVAPFYTAFALYGLMLRVQQYGWTPERLWGFVVAFTLMLLATSYSLAILRRGEHWGAWLRRINTGLALWVLAACLVTQSPLANFWRISATSQMARLQQEQVELAEFDFFFLRQKLGRPGLEALQQIATLPAVQQDPQMAAYLVELLKSAPSDWSLRQNPVAQRQANQKIRGIEVLPGGSSLPAAFESRRYLMDCDQAAVNCIWLEKDLNGDGESEFLLFSLRSRQNKENFLTVSAFALVDTSWQQIGHNNRTTEEEFDALRQRLQSGQTVTRASRWPALYLGDELLFDATQ
ncbi:DUF4153 domain-containing protein [Microbulbifer sp. ALW1]|uniref:DUF4153 domain-containing protein n=1 Tax=Microbulbifer sp. (strain ALW1) TaxID=1516059 RepID=UPI00135AB384|nr:DUF4153 domain-containing protein [Microbulbifer sp. ALW1]